MRRFFLLLCSLTMLAAFGDSATGDIDTLKQAARGFSHVAKKAVPAVVSIRVKLQARPSNGGAYEEPQDQFYEDFLRRFFGAPPLPYNRPRTPLLGYGSGFIINKEGYILTNCHVVQGAEEIIVAMADETEYPAKLIGKDPDTDLAVIKIEGKDFPYLNFGDSDKLEVGEWVIAIGTPQGLTSSLTVGVVSAKGRNNLHLAVIEEYIQTDAAINRGNSGGPSLNVDSEVIGVNAAIASDTGSYIGIGFAIPSNIARIVADQLIAHGSVRRSFLGVIVKPVTAEIAEVYNLKSSDGFIILEVVKGSSAEKAGLKWGDVITALNGQAIKDFVALRKFLALTEPGTQVEVEIVRAGEKKTVAVTLEVDPQLQQHTEAATAFGLVLTEGEQGIVLQETLPNTPAARANLLPGSLITAINNKAATSLTQCHELLQEALAHKKVLLWVQEMQGHKKGNKKLVPLKLD